MSNKRKTKRSKNKSDYGRKGQGTQDPASLNVYGITLFRQGKCQEAVSVFRQALLINSNLVDTHQNLGVVLNALGNVGEAETHFQHVIQLNPRYAQAYINLGALYRKQGKPEQARTFFTQAIEREPNNHHGYSYLGNLLSEQGHYQEAITHFRRAIELNPQDSRSLSALGNLYRIEGSLEAAAACYQKVIAVQPHHAAAHHNLGILLKSQGKTDDSIPYFERALELDPLNVSTQHELAAAQGRSISAAHPDYIKNLFDQYAGRFDKHLLNELGYQTPKELARLLKSLTSRVFEHAIDIGCGTGLCGVEFQTLARHFTGVDLSPNMCRKAKEKGIYHEIFKGDAVDILSESTQKFDLFIACDALVYTGDLHPLFTAVNRSAEPDAYFVFSTEYGDEPSYTLQSSGRYAHHPDYIQTLIQTYSFTLMTVEKVKLRKEQEGWIIGNIYALKKEQAGTFSSLFQALADGQGVQHPESIRRLLEQGAVVENGPVLPPAQLPKRLTQYANAQNILNVFSRVHDQYGLDFDREIIVEIGAGTGYLKYLLSLFPDHPTGNTVFQCLIETEYSRNIVSQNATQGKRTLPLSIAQIPERLGRSLTPCLIGLNVMDLFPQPELIKNMKSICDTLKPGGLFIHIMSSSIHQHIFDEITDRYSKHLIYPYHNQGYIGVRAIDAHLFSDSEQQELGPTSCDLPQLFAHSSEKYLTWADRVSSFCRDKKKVGIPILFKDFFREKMGTALKEAMMELVLDEEITASLEVPLEEHHRHIPDTNYFHNKLGALYTETAPEQKKGYVTEKATFHATIARKPVPLS